MEAFRRSNSSDSWCHALHLCPLVAAFCLSLFVLLCMLVVGVALVSGPADITPHSAHSAPVSHQLISLAVYQPWFSYRSSPDCCFAYRSQFLAAVNSDANPDSYKFFIANFCLACFQSLFICQPARPTLPMPDWTLPYHLHYVQ